MRIDPDKASRDRRYLAEALRNLRRASALSGERLAVRCGISQSKVSRIETGRILAAVTGVQQVLTALAVDPHTTLDRLAREHGTSRYTIRRRIHTARYAPTIRR